MTLLEVFDLPPMSPNCIQRAYSTVSIQALQMTNSAFVRDRARYLAGRLLDAFPNDPRRQVEQLYLRALGRPAGLRDEVQAALRDMTTWKVSGPSTWRLRKTRLRVRPPHVGRRWLICVMPC